MASLLHLTGPILVGPGEVLDEIWVADGRIMLTPPAGTADVESIAGWVLPGLIDAHCHVGIGPGGPVLDPQECERQAIAVRDAGTLLIRDAGSPADTRWMDEREDLPKIVRAGRHLARNRRYIRGLGHEIEPEDLVAFVRQEALRGDGWVKIVGDWIDRETGDLAPCWPAEVVAAAVTAAHELGVRMTAHCFGEQSLVDLAAAGIDCVEHATGLVPETIEAFAAQGITIVPTLVNIDNFPAFADAAGEKFPAYRTHMLDLHERRYATVAAAHDAGIPIRLGTDAGGSIAHGRVADEAVELGAAGLTNDEVLDAACWAARSWLGHEGITEGAAADLVVYAADPREDLHALQDPHRIVLRGKCVR